MGKRKSVIKLRPDTWEIMETYPSITEAGRRNYISPQAISMCLSGKNDTAAGYAWRYSTYNDHQRSKSK